MSEQAGARPGADYWDFHRAISLGAGPDSAPDLALRVLADIRDGRRELTAVRHPLGFYCLPVHRAAGLGVCIHLWTGPANAPAVTTSRVHSHSWDLLSYVLYGEIHNQRVDVVNSDTAPTHRVFEVRSNGDLDEILATSRLVRSVPAGAERSRTGEVYALPAGRFHRTDLPAQQDAATVVLGQDQARSADLSLGGIDTPSHRVRRQRCPAVQTTQLARTVIRTLAGAVSA
jgi:hypothetical protein